MKSLVFNPVRTAVLYYFGDLNYWKLPDIATEALVAGFDGIALRKIAWLTKNVAESDLPPADIDAAFREMGVDAPISKDTARLALAAEAARRALSGASNVFDEATHIRIHLCELSDPPRELQEIFDVAQRAQRNIPRANWPSEGELKTAMSQFLLSQPNVIDISR